MLQVNDDSSSSSNLMMLQVDASRQMMFQVDATSQKMFQVDATRPMVFQVVDGCFKSQKLIPGAGSVPTSSRHGGLVWLINF